jgi:hypothetical protein
MLGNQVVNNYAYIQKASLRTSNAGGNVVLDNAPTPGNLLVWIVAGYTNILSFYPANFGRVYSYSTTNQLISCFTKIAEVGDTDTFAIGVGGCTNLKAPLLLGLLRAAQ